MQDRPRILYVASEWHLPTITGGHERILNLSKLLGRVGEVSFAIIQRRLNGEETARVNSSEFDVRMATCARPQTPKGAFDRLWRRIRRELDPGYLATDVYAVSDDDRLALLDLIREHDVVWIHDVRTANSCRIGQWPHSVLDTVDVQSNLQRSKANLQKGPLRRLLGRRAAWIWKRRERLLTRRFDVITVCSENERKLLDGHGRVYVVPNGFSPRLAIRSPSAVMPRVGFIGTLTYEANRDGLEWFVNEVWPIIRCGLPHVQLRLLGSGTDTCSAARGSGVTGLGWVEDPADEIGTWSAMVIPIRFGAGTRVKMAEGFARKCPIVATSTGAYGYGVRDGEECLLADAPRDFASACVRLVGDPRLGRELAERAHQRFLREWTWDAQEGKVRAVIHECLARTCRQQAGKAATIGTAQKSGKESSAWVTGDR